MRIASDFTHLNVETYVMTPGTLGELTLSSGDETYDMTTMVDSIWQNQLRMYRDRNWKINYFHFDLAQGQQVTTTTTTTTTKTTTTTTTPATVYPYELCLPCNTGSVTSDGRNCNEVEYIGVNSIYQVWEGACWTPGTR